MAKKTISTIRLVHTIVAKLLTPPNDLDEYLKYLTRHPCDAIAPAYPPDKLIAVYTERRQQKNSTTVFEVIDSYEIAFDEIEEITISPEGRATYVYCKGKYGGHHYTGAFKRIGDKFQGDIPLVYKHIAFLWVEQWKNAQLRAAKEKALLLSHLSLPTTIVAVVISFLACDAYVYTNKQNKQTVSPL